MDTVNDFTKLLYMNDKEIDKGLIKLQNVILGEEPFSNDLNDTQQILVIVFIIYFSYIFINLKFK